MITECQSIDELEEVGSVNAQCWMMRDMHTLINTVHDLYNFMAHCRCIHDIRLPSVRCNPQLP